MLRRKPTALTITNEDIAAFNEACDRRLAYAEYLKTGKDPEGLFRHGDGGPDGAGGSDAAGSGKQGAKMQAATTTTNDPSDELKPVPGDKARIVRSREERIMGGGGGGGSGGGGGRGGR